MTRTIFLLIAALLASFLNASAIAQQPALPAPVMPPLHNCVKPEYPGKHMSEAQRRTFMRSLDTYKTCIQKFAGEQEVISKAAHAAYSSAIKEYNDHIAELNQAAGNTDKSDGTKPISGGSGPSSGY